MKSNSECVHGRLEAADEGLERVALAQESQGRFITGDHTLPIHHLLNTVLQMVLEVIWNPLLEPRCGSHRTTVSKVQASVAY